MRPQPLMVECCEIEEYIEDESNAQTWIPVKRFTRKCRKGVNIPGQACRGPPEAIVNPIL
jgi:hypothetical protein